MVSWWENSRLTKILWVALVLVSIISVVVVNFMIPDEMVALFIDFIHQDDKPEIEPQEQISLPTTLRILNEWNVTKDSRGNDGYIEKSFTHGDTEIIFSVGVENGVEETPPPSVLKAMRDSYTEEEQQSIDERTLSYVYKRFNYGTVWIANVPMSEKLVEMSKMHINDKLKKQFIDANFTCDNFGDMAKRFLLEPLNTDGWSGSTENYIYTKAVNECYDNKIQEKIDKVTAELEEVNKPN